VRIDAMVKARLVEAARLRRVKLTEFMVKASELAAEAALAERVEFSLPPGRWREFIAALDAPPREVSALRRLFTQPSVFGV
jgi:uncharacterized protein (DUF1778 family)